MTPHAHTPLVSIFIVVLAVVLDLPLPATASKCNTYNPSCGLDTVSARRLLLTPYATLSRRLSHFEASSAIPFSFGPLFQSPAHPSGILDIDVPLSSSLYTRVNVSVCDNATASSPPTTIRSAVICTVSNDILGFPSRGNLNASRIGFSNLGRPILAVRLGAIGTGTRVLITTQIHGNEPAGTEAALRVLRRLSRGHYKRLSSTLDMLFVVRVNVDAGEPAGDANPNPTGPYSPSADYKNFAFFRQNVDGLAGGAFQAPSEPGFFGAVGRGYDLNRYNYFGLDAAIRPVEAQAVVAAALAFNPKFMFDLHGDLQKSLCDFDLTSVTPPRGAIVFPTLTCRPPAPATPSLAKGRRHIVVSSVSAYDAGAVTGLGSETFRKTQAYTTMVRTSRNVAEYIMRRGEDRVGQNGGVFTRFSQVQLAGASGFSTGLTHLASSRLGAMGTLIEVLNFRRATRPTVAGVDIIPGGNASTPPTVVPNIGFDTEDVEPCFLRDNVCIMTHNLKNALFGAVKFAGARPKGDGGFCGRTVNNGLFVDAIKTYYGDLAVNGSFIVPQAGLFGIPVSYNGRCEGDVVP